MRVEDTKAIRIYGPYGNWGQHWIAHTPEGDVQNFKDPIDLAIWLDERAGCSPGSVGRQITSMVESSEVPREQTLHRRRTDDGPALPNRLVARDMAHPHRVTP